MTAQIGARLDGQIALLTGGTDGIGRQTALRLARLGADVMLVGRNQQKGNVLVNEISTTIPNSSVRFQQADLSEMRGVQTLVEVVEEQYPQVDMLIHCAGVMLRNRTLTREGLETVFAVQYLSRFLLTHRLLPLLKASPNGRVVDVSAGGAINTPLDFDNLQGEKHYSGVKALTQESVANDMLILEIAPRHPEIQFYNYGPWYVRTTLLRDMPVALRVFANTFGRLISISPEQAADDILTMVTGDFESGLYGRKARHNVPSPFKADSDNRQRLWQISEQLIAKALSVS